VLYMKNKKLTAIFFLFIGIIVLAIIGLGTRLGFMSREEQPKATRYKSGSELTIFVATDIHYLAKSLIDNGQAFTKYVEEGDGRQLNYIGEITDAFVEDIKEKKPEILIISGDLTNHGEAASHEELAGKLAEIEKQGTSVFVIPGNHDLLNPWARGFRGNAQYKVRSVDTKDFCRIYGAFGYNEAVLRDETTLSYLAAPAEDIWLLMLDTSQYNNNQVFGLPQTDGVISSSTLEWAQRCMDLAKENNAELIPIMHHNLMDHSEVITDGFTVNNSKEILELFKKNEVEFAMSGHIHIQDISSKDSVYDIVNSAFAVYPQQYGILKYSPSAKTYSYSTSWVDVEKWAEHTAVKDDNLLNFKKYSEDFFGKLAYKMADKHLSNSGDYDAEERQKMAEVVRTLNIRYFAGMENMNSKDVMLSEGYRLWSIARDGFLKKYVESITADKDTEDNSIQILLK